MPFTGTYALYPRFAASAAKGILAAATLLVWSTQVHGAELFLKPIGASGSHTIIGNQIILDAPGQTVTLELRVDNWAPQASIGVCTGTEVFCDTRVAACDTGDCIQASDFMFVYQGRLDSRGYRGLLSPVLLPAVELINTSHPEWVFLGAASIISAVDSSVPGWAYGALIITGPGPAFQGVDKYGGTLVLDVPGGASGNFTIDFVDVVGDTFFNDASPLPIVPRITTPAMISIKCSGNAECDDGLACTADACNLSTELCENTPSSDTCVVANECVSRDDLDPFNECRACIPEQNPFDWSPRPRGTACDDFTVGGCDTCDGDGICRQCLVLRVDESATGPEENGLTWCAAFTSLQDTLGITIPGLHSLRVAGGTYHPDDGMAQTPGDRAASFELPPDVPLRGGYAGCDAPEPDERNPGVHRTILSGDLADDDNVAAGSPAENSLHVVVASASDELTLVDGITIMGGNANGPLQNGQGGGVVSFAGRAAFHDCTFDANAAIIGGALYLSGADHEFRNCLLTANSATTGAGAFCADTTLSMHGCTLADNAAGSGAAVACDSFFQSLPSTVSVVDSILWNDGAEVFNNDGSAITFSYSDVRGGAAGVTNFDDDPLFAPGPVGCYYLSQTLAGQSDDSPGLDAGSELSVALGQDAGTTRIDEGVDAGTVDIGFHHPVTGLPLVFGDFDRNAAVSLADHAEYVDCQTGVGPVDVSPCCRIFDRDSDSDVDLRDAAAVQNAFSQEP